MEGCGRSAERARHGARGYCMRHYAYRRRTGREPSCDNDRVEGEGPDHFSRFWSRVDIGAPTECWPWLGGKHESGYGQARTEAGRKTTASRMAYILTYGDISTGLIVRHRCDNPTCCNPRHLETGTYRDNTADMYKRGRAGWSGRILTSEEIARIYAILDSGSTQAETAAIFGTSRNTVQRLASRREKTSVLESKSSDHIQRQCGRTRRANGGAGFLPSTRAS